MVNMRTFHFYTIATAYCPDGGCDFDFYFECQAPNEREAFKIYRSELFPHFEREQKQYGHWPVRSVRCEDITPLLAA